MKGKAVSGIILTLPLISMLTLTFNVHQAFASPTEPSLSKLRVPFYYQKTGYYCGPACLEMVFDYYGPDIWQYEIGDAACTQFPYGTGGVGMRRAAHFSNISFSIGSDMPWTIQGYSNRTLGYSAFERYGMTLDELKLLIDNGYPVIVATWYSTPHTIGHYRVVVGYDERRDIIIFHDPWLFPPYAGPYVRVTEAEFLKMWEMSYFSGLFASPWNVAVSAPHNVQRDTTFTITANITYLCPDPFSPEEYPASSCNATLTLPEGLSIAPGETIKKTLGTGNLSPKSSATVNWVVQANTLGNLTLSVEAEGKITGYMYPHHYQDRIGGTGNHDVFVHPPPQELVQELTTTIETWQLPKGTENCLTSKLDNAVHILNKGNENGAIHKLMDFMNQVQALQGKKLMDDQADYLIAEAQRIIALIEE